MPGADIAVVDVDDLETLELIGNVLHRIGFTIMESADADGCVKLVGEVEPRLTVVSSERSSVDPAETTRRIRAISSTLIVIVSGDSDEASIVGGLAAGADAYITKPVSPRVLRARIKAVLERSSELAPLSRFLPASPPAPPVPPTVPAPAATPAPAPVPARQATPASSAVAPAASTADAEAPPAATEPTTTDPGTHQPEPPQPEPQQPEPQQAAASTTPEPPVTETVIRARGLVVDTIAGDVEVDGRPVELTDDEFEVLAVLLTGARRALSRSILAQLLFGIADGPTDADRRAVDAVVTSLRAKIGDSTVRPRWIEEVPGVGYRRTLR